MLFWSGVVTGGLGFALFLRRRARYDAGESGEDRNNTTRIVQAVGLLGLYVFLFEAVGFHVTTAFMTAGIVALAGERRWSRVLTFAGAATIGTYIVLELWLGLRLPTGVLDVR